MKKLSTLGSLLEELNKTKSGLPKVELTNNSYLRDTVRGLVATTLTDADASVESISTAVAEYETLENDRLNNAQQFRIFNTIANAFATKLHHGVETLRNIKQDVTVLTETVNNRITTRLAEDAFLSKYYNIDTNLTMKEIEWNKLDNINERGIIIKLHDSIRMDENITISAGVISLLINKIPCTNKNDIELIQITIPDDKFKKIVDAIAVQVTDYSREYIAGALRNIFELSARNCQVAANKLKSFASGNDANEINKMLSLADSYNQILPLMNNSLLDLAESTMAELEKHIDIIQHITDLTIYLCSHYRNTIWKDSIIVPGSFCNPDTMDEYVEQGGNIAQLCHHKNEFYPDGKIPIRGISGKYIIDKAKTLDEKIEQRVAIESQKAEILKKEITRDEFIYTGVEWLNEHKKLYSRSFNYNDLSKYTAAIFDTNIKTPLTTMFYDLILKSCYTETIVPEIYNRLTKAYVKHAISTESISQDICNQIELSVYSDMVAEYLVTQNILIV